MPCSFHRRLTVLVLFAFALALQAQSVETYSFLNLNRAVPDGNAAGLNDVRAVASLIDEITLVRARLVVAGEFNGDLFAYLRRVDSGGTNYCVLLNRPGRDEADPFGYDDAGLDVIFDDAAVNGNIHSYRSVTSVPIGSPLRGIWRPDGRTNDPGGVLESQPPRSALASFAGSPASGEWTLFVSDVDSGGTNLLLGWELELTGLPSRDRVAYVLAPLIFTNLAAHAGTLSGALTFGLGPGAPAGAQVNPTNGIFCWAPSRQQARSVNFISIWVRDSGHPPTWATNTFMVRVEDYAELDLGQRMVLAGHTSSR
jgi:hypothetical protein